MKILKYPLATIAVFFLLVSWAAALKDLAGRNAAPEIKTATTLSQEMRWPSSKESEKSMARYLTSTAGTASVSNKIFAETGVLNSRPYYVAGSVYIYFKTSDWIIGPTLDGNITSGYYSITSSAATPPLSGWGKLVPGTNPVPTLKVADLLLTTNAGTTASRGTYIEAGVQDSKPYYFNGTYYLYFYTSGGSWMVGNNLGGGITTVLYVNVSSAATPPLTGWSQGTASAGALPAPIFKVPSVYNNTNAGITAARGDYVEDGVYSSVPTYSNGTYKLYYVPTKWLVSTTVGNTTLSSQYAIDTAATLPPLTGWGQAAAGGTLPAPIWTLVGSTPAPTITSIAPTSGIVGSSVILTGTNFTGATSVKFYNNVTASFTVDSATQITATVPSGSTTGIISVSTPGGTATSGSFSVIVAPTISSILPSPGVVGQTVVIQGTSFTNATSVVFASNKPAAFTVNSSTQITAIIPVGAVTGPISVTTIAGVGVSSSYPIANLGNAKSGAKAMLLVDGYDLSFMGRSAAQQMERDNFDCSTFALMDKENVPGMRGGILSVEMVRKGSLPGYSAIVDGVIVSPSTLPLILFAPEGAGIGDPCYIMRANETSATVQAPASNVAQINAAFSATGGARLGKLLLTPRGSTAGVNTLPVYTLYSAFFNGPGLDNFVATARGAVAHLHAIYADGVGKTVSLKIQHSSDNGVSDTWADIVTFAAQTDIGSQRLKVTDGTIIKRYTRAIVSSGGITGTWAFAVALSRSNV